MLVSDPDPLYHDKGTRFFDSSSPVPFLLFNVLIIITSLLCLDFVVCFRVLVLDLVLIGY